ncbi:hypothetical protein [Aquicella lusitana]|uniref:Membrane-associated protein n=1 Tax=Aquicella lusitana TaxID=254246 RepID=A0A370GLD6_9COXI|nr:hypothetical protein [Aquicella lusitana]RDI42703.1 hypothetical protein C8D86_11332 [Aquicella lusitana]VVC73442.1 hypothetical protein AQULUS_11820 [Aquicella lusitana]
MTLMEPISLLFTTKILVTLFVAVLVPVYWKHYGPQNFLWLSDIGLFLTCLALWFQSPLLVSMAIIGILPFEVMWVIDFCYQLLRGSKWLGVSDYMFDSHYSAFLRGLSLFHIVMPVIWIVCLIYWGYDVRAFYYQTALFWVVIILTYLLTDPKENINWVFMPQTQGWRWLLPQFWLAILLIGSPLFLFWPLHSLLKTSF